MHTSGTYVYTHEHILTYIHAYIRTGVDHEYKMAMTSTRADEA